MLYLEEWPLSSDVSFSKSGQGMGQFNKKGTNSLNTEEERRWF